MQASAIPALPPLRGAQLVLASVAVSLATFMNILDTSVANVSLSAITGDLGATPHQGTWVITSFGVANAIAIPLTGWLSQRFGVVKLFVVSTLLFTLASWLCGLAPSLELLIVARVIQGLVAGPMIPLSQVLLLSSYPPAKSGVALAIWAMTSLIAPALGPVLGGWITDNMSWPWIFYINVPVGLASAAITWAIYAKRETPTRRLPIDRIGLVLLMVWVGALQIMLDKGKELDWFESTEITVLAVTVVIGFALFLVWELTEKHPIVDIKLFAGRNFTLGTLALSIGFALYFGSIVLIPMWLQQFMGYTATAAGMVLTPVGIFAVLLSPVVGKNISKVDPRKIATLAFFIFAVALWMRSNFNTQVDMWTLIAPTIVTGAGLACFFVPLMAISLSNVSPDRIASASGLMNFARLTAGAFGTSIATTVWSDRATMHHAHLVEHLGTGDAAMSEAVARLGAMGLGPEQAKIYLNRAVDQQAYTLAADDIFIASAVLFLLMSAVVWFTRPVKGAAPGAGAAAGE